MFLESIFSMYTVFLASLFALLVYVYSSRNFRYWKKRNVFYFKPVPFFGNFLDIALFRTTIGEYLAQLYNKTSEPFFGIYVFDAPRLIIRSPEIIKHILVKDFKYFDNRTIATNPDRDPMVSSMLFLNHNPEWKILRNKMSPVFTSGKLKAMVPLINSCAESMKHYLEKRVGEESLDAKEVCAKFSTNVIARCAFGINAHCFENEEADFRKIGRLMFDFSWSNAIQQTAYFMAPCMVKLFNFSLIHPHAITFLRDCFWDTIQKREKSNIAGDDVIDTIIKIKNSGDVKKEIDFEGDKVVAQATQFFLAGFETTSSAMAFTLYELSLNPQIQQRLRTEINSCLQQHGGFTYEAIQSMTYLQMCISETLRKYPALPFLDRRCNEDYKIPESDVIIEKGTAVYIPMFGLHYDERYFPNPQKYDPERFSEANSSKLTPYSYMPFGEGPRICIGERFGLIGTKLGLAHILSEFEVERTKSTPDRIEFEPKSIALASKVGIPIRFKRPVSSAG